jgi:protein ImuA
VRNDVPGGEHVGEFPPSGVERAGGAKGKGLIELLRGQIRALEQVPVSLAFPPIPGAGRPRPACSLSLAGKLSSPMILGFTAQSNSPGIDSGLQQTNKDQEQRNILFSLGSPEARPVGNLTSPGCSIARARGPILSHKEEGEPALSKLAAGGLHEIKPASNADHPAALAFAIAFLSERIAWRDRAASPLLWCLTERTAREWGAPYGPGLLSFGLDPARCLIIQARNRRDAAWALEEGLKSCACIAALGQIEVKTPLIARRLGLAAQTSRTPCLLLSGYEGGGLPGTLTRWRIGAAGSRPANFDSSAPGATRWHLTLERCREMRPEQSWIVEFSHGAYGLHLAAALADRAAEAGEGSRALSG